MRNRLRRALREILAAESPRPDVDEWADATEIEVSGGVESVDPVSRLLVIQVDGSRLELYVPIDCQIRIDGRLVRLRQLQSGERVQVTYCTEQGIQRTRMIRSGRCDAESTINDVWGRGSLSARQAQAMTAHQWAVLRLLRSRGWR